MKKLLLLLLTIMTLGFFAAPVSAQETLTVHDGTTTNSYVPVYGFYADAYLKAEFIMSADELSDMIGGEITAMTFYASQSNVSWGNANFQVFLTEVDGTTVNAFNGSSDATVVYTGPLSIVNGQMEITFSTSYSYNGGNLLIGVYNTAIGTYVSSYWYGETVTGASFQGYSYSSLTAISGTQRNFLPKTTFTYFNSSITCFPPYTPTITDVTDNEATFFWTPREGQDSWQVYCDTAAEIDPEQVSWTTVSDTFNTFFGLQPNTHYYAYVRADCGEEQSVVRSTSFWTSLVPVQVPFTCDFEDDNFNANWAIRNGNQTNKWFIGSAVNHTEGGENALYISDNNGESNTYDITGESTVWAFMDVEFPDGNQFALSFDYQVNGEDDGTPWDYLRVLVGTPTNVEVGVDEVPDNVTVYGSYVLDSVWTTTSILLPGTLANSVQRLYFLWRNDDNTGANPPVAIDNLDFSIVTCSRPNNVSVSDVTAHTATVTFQPAVEDDYSWEYALCPDTISLDEVDPVSISDTVIELSDLYPNTTYKVYVRTVCGGGNTSIWTNPVSFTTQVTCTSPTSLTVTQITGNSALVSWHAATLGATEYTLAYKAAEEDEWITETVTESPYMLSDLESQTIYQVKVTSVCDEGDAPAISKTFSTPCLAGGTLQVGEGTTTTYFVPINNYYKYSYTQQIFLASEMNGPTTINGVSFEYGYTTPSSKKTNVTIYLGHTTQSSFTDTSNYIPVSGLQQVYTGELNCIQGWNTFAFSTPFQYNGTDNLVVVVDDNSNDYNGSSYVFRAHDAGTTRSLYYYNDTNNPDPSNPTAQTIYGTTSNYRSNIIFNIPCDETAPCLAPNAYLSDITTESITVNWVPGNDESSWELEYKASHETEWNTTTVSESPYTIEDLNPNTLYNIRMMSICDDGYSDTVTLQTRTECAEIADLPFTDNFDSYGVGTSVFPACWTKINTAGNNCPYVSDDAPYEGAGCLYFYASNAGTYNMAVSPQFASSVEMNNLQASFMYRGNSATDRMVVGVISDLEDATTFVAIDTIQPAATATDWVEHVVYFSNYTGEGHYIAFKNLRTSSSSYSRIDNLVIEEIADCPKPTMVSATSTPSDTVIVSWQSESDAWDVVYGISGFDPNNEEAAIEIFENITENPFTLTGLAGGIGYDIYVRTNCGDNVSGWSTSHGTAYPFSYTMGIDGSDTVTGCGFTITDNGGPNGEYSNSCDFKLVIYPSDIDSLVSVSGTFAGEGSYDKLYIYDGASTLTADQIDVVTGTNSHTFGPYVSSSGPLTLRFYSDFSNTNDGFVAIVSCVAGPNCPSPVKNSVSVSNIDGHNATVSFTDLHPDHDSWTIYYRESAAAADEPWMTLITNDTSATLTNLEPLTQYDVYVVTNCDIPDDTVQATNIKHFTTAVACPAPQNFVISDLTTTSATVSWFSNAESFVMVYGETNSSEEEETEIIITESTYEFTGLEPNTSYTVQVAADCGEDSLSATATYTFTTLCEELNVPYSENFNSYTVTANSTTAPSTYPNDVMPDCWSYINKSQTTGTYPQAFLTSSSTYAVSGNCLFFKSSSTIPLYAVLPHFTDALNTLQITFTYRNEGTGSSNGTLHLGYMTDLNDLSSYTEITSYAQTTTKTEITEVLDDIPAEDANGFIVFKYVGGTYDNYYLGIDNILVETIPSCPRPSDVEITGASNNSLTLSWTNGSTETAWQIAYGTPGFNPDSDSSTVVSAGSNPFTVENLTSSTQYEFYVRAICTTTDQSTWSNPLSGSTDCDVTTLPYTENFDSYAGTTYSDANGVTPLCWTTYGTSTTYGAPHVTSSGLYHWAHSGTNSLTFTCNTNAPDQYAALPTFDQPLNTLKLNFWRRMESATSGTLTVGYVTNLSDLPNSFVAVAEIPSIAVDSLADTISVDFTGADIPATGNICFHWYRDGLYYSCCIDDVVVTLAGSGPGPVITDPTVTTENPSGVEQTVATMNATITNPDGVTITGKGFQWKLASATEFTNQPVTGNEFSYTLNNLTPNTDYEYKAYITYNGVNIYGNVVSFTTLEQGVEPCAVPTGLAYSDLTHSSFTVTWNANPDATGYTLRHRPANGQWTSVSVTTNSHTLTGLNEETTYEVQVQADCGNGNTSDWSASLEVVTPPNGIPTHLLNSIALYPNPAKDYVDVRVDGDVNVTNMEVFDVYGKLINTVNVVENPTRINVSGLANGMYFVRVTTDNGAVTKTFVKQ